MNPEPLKNKIFYGEEIKCPYCGYKITDVWEFFTGENFYNGAKVIVECEECGKKYEVILEIHTEYHVYKLNDERCVI